MHQLLTFEMPYKEKLIKNDNLFKKVVSRGKIKIPSYLADEAKDLMGMMLESDPKKRATADEILRHPWLQDYCDEESDSGDYFEDSEDDYFDIHPRRHSF